MKNLILRKQSLKILFIVFGLFLIFAFYSCDFSITNPGPVNDSQLNNPSTFTTTINGMKKTFANAQNEIAYIGAAVAKQITAAGSVSSFGISLNERDGNLLSSEEHVNGGWNSAQEARWVSENGIKRIKDQLGDKFSSSKIGVKALIWNGYANRLLGENMCTTIIDGGAPQKNKVYFERAEMRFTNAIENLKTIDNTKLLTIAYAGRASVRVYLNKWDGAVLDAKKVPMDFVFASQRSDIKTSEYNQFYWGNANQPYRAHSVVDTYYEDYYKEYNDPRVSWNSDPDIPYGDGGAITWLFQTKYDSKSSAIKLSSGHEMILIRAEAELRSDNWQKAIQLINSIRQEVGVKPWQANNETEAWTRLKRERGIELWLEARRLGDLRRWTQNDTPGKMENMEGRDLCFPVGQDEKERNPNVD